MIQNRNRHQPSTSRLALLWLVCIFLLGISARAAATVLGDVANQMAPGTFVDVTTQTGETGPSMTNLLREEGSTNLRTLLEFALKGHWDPTRRVFMFSGSPHASDYRRLITYDDSSNQWSSSDFFVSQGHNYDMETIDPATGDFYRREKGFGATEFYRLPPGANAGNGSSWTTFALPGPDQTSSSIEWFSQQNGLVLNSGNRGLQIWNKDSGQWTEISTVIKDGDTNHWTLHNPVRGEILFGPKSKSSLAAYRLTANLNVQQVSNVPLEVGPGSANAGTGVIAADPVSGDYVIFERAENNGRVFASSDGNNWQQISSDHPIDKIDGWMIGAAIDTYGVIMIIPWDQTGESSVWLYKHQECNNCPDVDSVAPSPLSEMQAQ